MKFEAGARSGARPSESLTGLAFSEQPENEHENKYCRDNATAEFISSRSGQSTSQQVIHN
jgi:hypothetical protein